LASLPSTDDIKEAVADTAEAGESFKRRVAIVKSRPGGYGDLNEVASNEIAEYFKMDNTDERAADVRRMIEWLQENPVGRGCSVLHRVRPIRIDQKSQRVWRLAPEKTEKGLEGITGDNKTLRVVYTITGTHIAVLDVLTHEAYNKKWAGGGSK